MMCKKCGKNEASVYLRRTVNGESSEIALCRECAESDPEVMKMMKGSMAGDLNFFGGLFDFPSVRGMLSSAKTQCPLCGATYEDIARSGMVGCAECYNTFRDRLASSIARLHGNVRHTGRAPARLKAKNERADRLKRLREEQQAAVAAENFERAAQLRDEIRSLENS